MIDPTVNKRRLAVLDNQIRRIEMPTMIASIDTMYAMIVFTYVVHIITRLLYIAICSTTILTHNDH